MILEPFWDRKSSKNQYKIDGCTVSQRYTKKLRFWAKERPSQQPRSGPEQRRGRSAVTTQYVPVRDFIIYSLETRQTALDAGPVGRLSWRNSAPHFTAGRAAAGACCCWEVLLLRRAADACCCCSGVLLLLPLGRVAAAAGACCCCGGLLLGRTAIAGACCS